MYVNQPNTAGRAHAGYDEPCFPNPSDSNRSKVVVEGVSNLEEHKEIPYDVSVGLELVLRNVKGVVHPHRCRFHDEINDEAKSIADYGREIDQAYEQLYIVANLLAGRWNSYIHSKNLMMDNPHEYAPMRSQLKADLGIDLEWSYDKWTIAFSRSLTDEFFPFFPFEFQSPTVPYENLSVLLAEINEFFIFLRATADVDVPPSCALHVQVSRAEVLWTVNELRMWKRSVLYFEKPLQQLLPEHFRQRRLSGLPLVINYGLSEPVHPALDQDADWYGYLLSPRRLSKSQQDNPCNPLAKHFNPDTLWQDDQVSSAKGGTYDYIVEIRGLQGINYAEECTSAIDLAVCFVHASLRHGTTSQLLQYDRTVLGLHSFLLASKPESMRLHRDPHVRPLSRVIDRVT